MRPQFETAYGVSFARYKHCFRNSTGWIGFNRNRTVLTIDGVEEPQRVVGGELLVLTANVLHDAPIKQSEQEPLLKHNAYRSRPRD